MWRLSPKHAEANHKPSLRHEAKWIGVESMFVAHEELADARFSDQPKAAFDDATGLRVPLRERRRRRRDNAHQVPGAPSVDRGARRQWLFPFERNGLK